MRRFDTDLANFWLYSYLGRRRMLGACRHDAPIDLPTMPTIASSAIFTSSNRRLLQWIDIFNYTTGVPAGSAFYPKRTLEQLASHTGRSHRTNFISPESGCLVTRTACNRKVQCTVTRSTKSCPNESGCSVHLREDVALFMQA